MATLGGGEGGTCMKLFNCIFPKCRSILLTLLSMIVDCHIKEHKRSTEKQDVANRIAVHHMETNHRIDWEGATCMELGGSHLYGFEEENVLRKLVHKMR